MTIPLFIRYTPQIESGTSFTLEHLFANRQAPVRWQGREYHIDFRAAPIQGTLCGEPHPHPMHLWVDQSSRWHRFSRYLTHTARTWQVPELNCSLTFGNLDKHHTYEWMARLILPEDHFPKTVLLPDYIPTSEEDQQHNAWSTQHILVARHTQFGWDETRRETDWDAVRFLALESRRGHYRKKIFLDTHYPPHDVLDQVMTEHFDGRFPVYLKPAAGTGGMGVYRCEDMNALRAKYRTTEGQGMHVQEAIEDYDLFVRCIAVGPQVLIVKFRPEEPNHRHYAPESLVISDDIRARIERYLLTLNAAHRWTFNSMECLIKGGVIHPIDFANANPDTAITSLHVHFPWVIGALMKWLAFLAIEGLPEEAHSDQPYLNVLNEAHLSRMERLERFDGLNAQFYCTAAFQAFCLENFSDIDAELRHFIAQEWKNILEHTLMKTAQFHPDQFESVVADLQTWIEQWLNDSQE